jgi:soluble cytochrome b562/flagellar biosynthesis chaperone FliJ
MKKHYIYKRNAVIPGGDNVDHYSGFLEISHKLKFILDALDIPSRFAGTIIDIHKKNALVYSGENLDYEKAFNLILDDLDKIKAKLKTGKITVASASREEAEMYEINDQIRKQQLLVAALLKHIKNIPNSDGDPETKKRVIKAYNLRASLEDDVLDYMEKYKVGKRTAIRKLKIGDELAKARKAAAISIDRTITRSHLEKRVEYSLQELSSPSELKKAKTAFDKAKIELDKARAELKQSEQELIEASKARLEAEKRLKSLFHRDYLGLNVEGVKFPPPRRRRGETSNVLSISKDSMGRTRIVDRKINELSREITVLRRDIKKLKDRKEKAGNSFAKKSVDSKLQPLEKRLKDLIDRRTRRSENILRRG